jgi:hypothetical protein
MNKIQVRKEMTGDFFGAKNGMPLGQNHIQKKLISEMNVDGRR